MEAAGGAAKGTLGAFFKTVKSVRCVICNSPTSGSSGSGGRAGICDNAACVAKAPEVEIELKTLVAETVSSQEACALKCSQCLGCDAGRWKSARTAKTSHSPAGKCAAAAAVAIEMTEGGCENTYCEVIYRHALAKKNERLLSERLERMGVVSVSLDW